MRAKTANLLALISILALSQTALTRIGSAEQDKGVKGRYAPPEIEGMRHISIGDEDEEKDNNRAEDNRQTKPPRTKTRNRAQQDSVPASQDSDAENKQDKAKDKQKRETATKPESHFKSQEDWQRLDVIPGLVSENEDKVNRALADVAAEPHRVTPYGLLLAARGHIEHGQMRQAVLYYYAAKLRTRFDGLRFPANNPSAVKHDRLFSQLAQQLSRPVYDWVFAKPERFDNVTKRLRKWTRDTPYAYKPLYPVPDMRPRDEWPKLHKQALEATFAMLDKRAKAYRQHQQ